MSEEPYTIRLPIRFTHTDPAGYVFFPRYFEMLQAAVEDWYTHGLGISYAGLVRDGFGLPTARTECEFLRPSRLGEILELQVVLERLGRSSMEVSFIGRVGGEVRVRARSVLVQILLGEGRPVPIEGELREALEAYLGRLAE
jgi:4-hydroxybenzoyl-CoA thioesterase